MTTAEARIRAACDALADALVDALAEDHDAPERLLTVPEAAELLAIGRTALYAAISSGRVRSVTIGRTRRVPVSAIAELVAEAKSRAA